MNSQYVYYLGNNICVEGGPNLVFCDNKREIQTIHLSLDIENNKYKNVRNQKDDKLFHLLTNHETFMVNGIKFRDYNASIDNFLEKIK